MEALTDARRWDLAKCGLPMVGGVPAALRRASRLLTVCLALLFLCPPLVMGSSSAEAEDEAFRDSVEGCRDAGEVELYLTEFGKGGRHAEEARACLEELAEVERLLGMCDRHFEANRLTTGVGGTAVKCYLEVLSRDPANLRAEEGLRRVFDKYAGWTRKALEEGDAEEIRGHVEKLRELNPKAPQVSELSKAIGALEIPEVGERIRDCDECPEVVVVPSGSFEMGSPSSEEERHEDEGPVHGVRIAEPFAVGVYEVTRGQWRRFVEETGHSSGHSCWTYEGGEWAERSGRSWRNPGFSQGEEHPVVCVSWEDAKAYVGWLSRKTGKGYRLLSESEWEYVARAGTSTPFHTGSTISTEQANYNGSYTYGSGRTGRYREKTVPVGVFPSNAFGLHDVHGNVWEWVEDCVNGSYRGAPADGSAWESGDCSVRVLRGGSWNYEPWYLRSAFRIADDTGSRNNVIGFRVARTFAP